MHFRRAVPVLVGLSLLLTGCFRQAPDTFDADSETNIQPQAAEDSASPVPDTPVIVDPDAGADDTATPDRPDPTDTPPPDATNTTLPPTNTSEPIDPTATIRIVQPTDAPTLTPRPQSQSNDTTVSTATPQFVTPGVNTQRELPTNTPSVRTDTETGDDSESASSGALTTPTALPGTEGGACEYVVESGDNLFRIALNNDVALEDLRSANNLSEGAVIQPGQRLVIPGCEEAGDTSSETVEATTVPTATPFTGEGIIYEVQSGDTLFTIAQEYGITTEDIIEANDIANPDRLSIGQELVIPVPAEDAGS